jgi:hypothetical protein
MRGTIITCYRSNLDGTPVLFLRSLRQLARGRVMKDVTLLEAEAEAWGRAKWRPSPEDEAKFGGDRDSVLPWWLAQ